MGSIRDLKYTTAHSEIWAGVDAEKIGNIGRVRVHARRGCWIAIDFWLEFHPEKDWGVSAISYLKAARDDEELPEEIRNAAARLTEKVNLDFSVSHNIDPLEDAEKIIEYFLDKKNLMDRRR